MKYTQEDFLKAIAEDKLKNLTFLMDISAPGSKKYKMLSKKTNKVIDLDLLSLSIKLQNLFNTATGNNLSIRDEEIKKYVTVVDEFTQVVTKEFGFKEFDDIRTFNYYIESQFKREINAFNEDRLEGNKRKSYEDIIDFNKYPCFKILIDQIINPSNDRNRLYDHKGQEVDITRLFLSFCSFCIDSKRNSDIIWLLRSDTHGIGKGTFTRFMQEILGDMSVLVDSKMLNSDFNGFLNNKTFVIYDEAKGNKDIYNTLKSIAGNKTYANKQKFKESYESENSLKFMITTNNKEPMPIEKGDRRFIVLDGAVDNLATAVKKKMNINLDEFIDRLEDEKLFFAADLCMIDYNIQEVAHTCYMNDVKKDLIKSNTKSSDDIVSIIKSLDFDALEEVLFDYKDTDSYMTIVNQMNAGFLTNDSLLFLNEKIEDSEFQSELRYNKKDFWNKVSEATRMVYRKKDGSQTSVLVRKLSNFDKQRMIDVLEDNRVIKEDKKATKIDDFDF